MHLATQTHLTQLRDALNYRLRELRAEVHAALQRLDGGTYGDCADCGKPISLQRLRVQPAAQRCTPCQAAREHAVGRSGSRTASP